MDRDCQRHELCDRQRSRGRILRQWKHLGHTECDVARGAGAPDNVNLSTSPRGDRVAVLTYSHGPRAGIYTFTSGRLTSVERGPESAAEPKAAKSKARKKPAAT